MIPEKQKLKAKKYARILGMLPGVRALFLSGSLAQGRGNENSDIDFFIIAREGQIWTARFFVFLTLGITSQLRREKNTAGKICPNHFITDQHLKIRERDAYSAHLFTHNIPLYDPRNIFADFVEENQEWVQKFGESFAAKQDLNPSISGLESKKRNFFWSWLESCLQLAQMEKIKRNPDFRIPGAKIILDDCELRFHPHPRNKNFQK
ncbi:nucleotidyltransferase domain-containing protein [Candidatus Gracilibacteria bacterium]|nr:nucleotidyltransferase domain-containing protein [Candidatus Gracilibacteria bacterium]MCF7818980.1 nucleotidyltransferase domain-containing protein [Candidatus Gracilibacteria bacterium]